MRSSRRLLLIIVATVLGTGAVFPFLAVLYMHLLNRAPVDPSWTDANVTVSLNSGDKIVKALDRYRAKHGRYPLTLQELVPTELSTVMPPIAGEGEWNYSTTDGTGYGLGFDSTVHPISWQLNSNNPHWWFIDRKSD